MLKTKAQKRILSVTIKRMADDSPDTSHLGEYGQRQTSKFSIDRAHAQDCASLREVSVEGRETLERIIERIEQNATVCENHIHETYPDCETCETEWAEQKALQTLRDLQETPECDCSGGDMGRNEYRYFNPSFNYVTKSDEPEDGLTAEDVRKYVRQDYERMERMNRGDWCYIGIRAEAEVGLPRHSDSYLVERLHSGGLWGIESNSEREYLESVEADELADLKTVLLDLGFSRRAIATAFRSVQKTDE